MTDLLNQDVLTCKKCGLKKSVESFYTKGSRRDARCKSCVLREKSKRRLLAKRAKAAATKKAVSLVDVSLARIELTQIDSNLGQSQLDDLVYDLIRK